jgi:hypothetical protein
MPKEIGPNPNIGTIIQFDAYLPKNMDFCPYLNVKSLKKELLILIWVKLFQNKIK